MPRAAIYARYSPGENQRDESVDAQIRMARDYAEKMGYSVVKVYADKATSGRTDKRGELQEMLNDAKKNLWDILIIDKVDRFARNKRDSVMHKYYLRKVCKKKVEYSSQFIDDSPEGELLEGILEDVAQWFSRNLARETLKGLTENAFKAWHTGGKILLGFSVEEVPQSRNKAGRCSKRLVINENEVGVVKKVFEIIHAGGTYRDAMEATRDQMILLRGRPLSKNSIYDILRNEKYKGVYTYQKGTKHQHRQEREDIIRIPGALPAIIPPEIFDRVQEILNSRRQPDKARLKAGRVHLLSGKVFCGKCGHAMVARCGYSKNKVRHDYYECGLKKRSKECDAKTIREGYVDAIVLQGLKEKVFSPEGRQAVIEQLELVLKEKQKEADRAIRLLEKERQEAQRTVENVVQAVVSGFRSEPLKERLHAAEARIKEIEYEIAAARSDVTRKLDKKSLDEFMTAQAAQLEGDLRSQKQIVQNFVKKVVTSDQNIEVHFSVGSVRLLLVALRSTMREANTVISHTVLRIV